MERTKSALKKCFALFFPVVWLAVFSTQALGESLVQQTVESRVVLAYRADVSAVQRFIPSPWRSNAIAKGPLQGANIFVVFGDRELDQDPDGKPRGGGVNRFVAFAAPASNPETGKSGMMVLRILTGNSLGIPGPYKNGMLASVSRKVSHSATDMEYGVGEEQWLAQSKGQADIRLTVRYRKALPSRAHRKFDVYSAVEPSFYRIYHVDQGTDIVMSKPANIDRLSDFETNISAVEFRDVFNGTEDLVGVAVVPWYVRQVFLP